MISISTQTETVSQSTQTDSESVIQVLQVDNDVKSVAVSSQQKIDQILLALHELVREMHRLYTTRPDLSDNSMMTILENILSTRRQNNTGEICGTSLTPPEHFSLNIFGTERDK